jgi:hypothetical protein
MSWEFTSHDQLTAAGYIWRGFGICQHCMKQILWYTNLDRKRIPVDPKTYTLHFITCAKKKATPDPKKVVSISKGRQAKLGLE